MKKLFFIAKLFLLLLSCNAVLIISAPEPSLPAKVAITAVLAAFYFMILFMREKEPSGSSRLRRLKSGCEILCLGGAASLIELVLLIVYTVNVKAHIMTRILAWILPVIMIAFIFITAVLKIIVSARQVKILNYILLLMFWWVPVANIFLIVKMYKTAKREYFFETDRIELENSRAVNEICKTKYPVLLIHGIFFRDWQILNYWGRIPAALMKNGAAVYYGKQQSAQSIADSAEELKSSILEIISKTGAEKVNIIAHSKGGLDSRYAISRLGMDKYVATLTTINTPHKGSRMADYLVDKLPDGIVRFITKRYNSIFKKLGDTDPDFMAGVNDLSAVRAEKYDEEMPDSPEVSYRSIMSVMKGAFSAGFPLNLGYMLMKKLEGPENDGLVSKESAVHGEFTLVSCPKKRGISHGDVIDLLRENIDGYDVREFYVRLVSELKEQGY